MKKKPSLKPTLRDEDWEIVWTTRGATRHVEIVNKVTGQRLVGNDFSDWDDALDDALRKGTHPAATS